MFTPATSSAPLLLAVALTLAACVPPTEDPSMPPLGEMEDACGASSLQHLVGQNRKVLETMKFAGPVRVIEPGMAVTLDFAPGRLNISLDDKGRIDRVACG